MLNFFSGGGSNARRRDIDMEKNELPGDPNDSLVSTVYVEKYMEEEKPSRKRRAVQVIDQPNIIKQLERILGASDLKNIGEPMKECCIYKVPRDLRNIDTKAYTPQVISIGPSHHGEPWLSEMENQKLRYVKEFGMREGPEKLRGFKTIIEKNEPLIRNHYQENFSLIKSPEFVNMILRDAVFIIEFVIEFFLKSAKLVDEGDFDLFLDKPYMRAVLARDLQLLENQLPYFLLRDLFEKGEFLDLTKKLKQKYPNSDSDPFLILSYRFFINPKDGVFPEPKKKIQHEIQHFTDLIRYFLVMDFLPQDKKQDKHVIDVPTETKLEHVIDVSTETKLEHVRDLPTATKLHGSGVKFKKGIEGGSSLKISCEKVPRAIPISYFEACELRIPCLDIDDWSECQYRNLMALELCHYPTETHICNFILLMNFLIDSEKDVDLLVDQGIIISRLGDNATVATMFNKLGFQITPSPSVYHNICEKLKGHYVKIWNHTMTTFFTEYFEDVWKRTATVVASILVVLTIIQATSSILSLL